MIKNCDNLKALFDFSQKQRDKKAVIYNNQYITYLEFKNMVISLSEELKQRGISKNDFVAIYMSNSIEMVLSMYAILNCNAIIVPINIDCPYEQVSKILNESKPKIILYNEHVVKGNFENNYNNIMTFCVDYRDLDKNNKSENKLIAYNPSDSAYCIFTSGSSGFPKGILLTYEGILNHIDAKISLLNLTSESRLCLSFNIGFVASIWQILTPILLGAQLYIYDNDLIKKPYHFLEQLERDEVDIVSMTPQSLYGYCYYLTGKYRKLQLQNIKYIILTGEKVDKAIVENFYKNYNHITLINAYGQSECSDDTFHYVIPQNVILDDIPIGKPIQNITYRILDDNLKDVASGEKGELYVCGICLSKGYLNMDQLMKEKFTTISNSIFYRTGDIVRLNKNQDVIYIGRSDNQIKIHGYRVEPEEIESHLNQIEGIKQSIVTVLDKNKIDNILCAFYTSDRNINSKDIKSFLSTKLPIHMIPSVFKRVEMFILNANGKMDRYKVLECKEIHYNEINPVTSNPNTLTDIQKNIFNTIISCIRERVSDNISLDMDLNSAGINSITFVSTIVALENKFDFEFDDEMLVITKFPTLKSMIKYVESKIT